MSLKTPHCMFLLANDWAMISCHYIDVITHYSDLIFCICWVYRWLYSFFSFFKGTMSEINQLRLALQESSTARNVAEGQCISLKVGCLWQRFDDDKVKHINNNCVLGVFEIFFSSMSCQNLKSRLRCMKVQADLVWD